MMALKDLLSSNVAIRGLINATIVGNKPAATELLKGKAEPKITKEEKGQITESKKKDSDAPKRPPGAFFIFMEELRNTYLHSFKLNFLGEKSEKAPYLEKASKRKAEYQIVLQGYKNKQNGNANTLIENDMEAMNHMDKDL